MKKKRVLPNGWHEVVIGKEFKTSSGGTPLSTRKEYYEGGTIPWINSGELNENYIDRTDNYITELGLNNSSAKLFPKGTVLVALYGATAGKTSLLNIDACTNQAICAILENSDYSNLFLKYNLENLYDYLVDKSTGSARDNLSQEGIAELSLFFPKSKDYQEKLIKILKDIDKKISINTRINAELEAMAKQLYDYWFVQFDFPDENGKPYKSSGGKMVYDEKLKRDIPEGWGIKTIDQIAKTPKTSINPYEYPDKIFKHYSIPAYDECGTYLHEKGISIQSNKYIVNRGQILTPKLNPWYNRIILVDNSEDSICSTEYVILDPVEEYVRGFMYYLVKTDGFVAYCTKGATGTSHSQRRVPPDVLKSYTFLFNRKIVESYTSCILPQIEMINQNLNKNKQLKNLRDSLLPMLMNGQVTVE